MWGRPPFHLRSVLVTLKTEDDTTARGIAWQTRGNWLVFRNVELLRPNVAPVKVDGELVIPRENIAFIQML